MLYVTYANDAPTYCFHLSLISKHSNIWPHCWFILIVGFVVASLSSQYSLTLSMPQMKAYVNTPDQEKMQNPLLKKKKFIVKVQVPVGK